MPLVLRVKGVRRETPGTRIVRVDLNRRSFAYQAGQAAMIGPAGSAQRVPYSIASAPEETRQNDALEFLIKTDPSGRWGERFPEPRRGMELAVDGPVGSFAFPARPLEQRLLFIAGGTGVAPIRSMVRHALTTAYPGRIRVLYSARTPLDFAYGRELRRLARQGQIELVLTATREVQRRWREGRGRLTVEQLASVVDDPVTRCFVCGPSAMVADIPPMLDRLGISRERIHVEQWGSEKNGNG
ncbi:MAG: hypothetical protein H0T05_02790 [Acidobacteria bacterium]|nr:hypothetical protein [Acidobacteriota bacterium]MBA3888722.1 hypothetical protein [Acidobacteriota bacterium]